MVCGQDAHLFQRTSLIVSPLPVRLTLSWTRARPRWPRAVTFFSAERIWQEMQLSLSEDHPEVFFEVLRSCQALKAIWPELEALWGVPNPAQWHPEICSGVHTMMVLKQAVLLTSSSDEPTVTRTAIRFAALCHDLGKALTQSEKWPSHHGHEKSGLALVKVICKKFKVPNQVKRLSFLVCEFHLHCHRAFELNPKTVLTLFDKLDVWRKPDDFELFLLCCYADSSGRLGKEQSSYPQADYLRQALSACKQVTAKEFVEQGLKGPAIKEAMNKAKIDEIAKVRQHFNQ